MTAEHGNHKIYRYKLDSNINDLLIRFSNIHKYASLDTFKEAWINWCESNNKIIVGEEKRLKDCGFTGDVKEKMYIASRYYYRKKEGKSVRNGRNGGSDCDVKCKQKRSYIVLDKSLLKLMDAHISQFIIDNNYKPSTGFDNFYEINKKVIETEIERLINHDKDKDIYAKIKKTYKNRYFKLR